MDKKHKDQLKGGLADKRKPEEFDQKQLEMGVKVEMEHTDDETVAREIAMDHLVEDPAYYSHLEEMEEKYKVKKQDRVEVTADGKQELDYGSERLDKDVKKSVVAHRWEELKKKLDHKSAIMDISQQEEPSDEGDSGAAGQDTAAADPSEQMGEEAPVQSEDAVQEADMGQEQPPEGSEGQPEGIEEAIDAQGQHMEDQVGEEPPMDQDSESDEEMGDQDKQEEFNEELLEQMLREDGHTDSEIQYILHGHIPAIATMDDVKQEAEKALQEIKQGITTNEASQAMQHKQELHEQVKSHRQRMQDLEHQKAQTEMTDPETEKGHRSRMLDIEYEGAQKDIEANKLDIEHKKRMLDLEYEKAKKEADMDIKNKEKEYQLKLELMKEGNKQKAAMQQEQHKSKMAMQSETAKHKMSVHKDQLKSEREDAKKVSKDEKSGKDKT